MRVTGAGAISLLTYLWHYVVARLVYDDLVRPVIHGHLSTALLVCGVCLVGFAAGRWSARRRS